MANKPNNPSLWSKAKSLARQKFDVYPSAYANGWAAKWYKSKGGTWRKAEYGMQVPYMEDGGKPEWLLEAQLKAQGYSGNALSQKMAMMAEGGEPQNEGFQALPEYVQAKILSNMGYGGYIPEMGYGGAALQDTIDRLQKREDRLVAKGYKAVDEGRENKAERILARAARVEDRKIRLMDSMAYGGYIPEMGYGGYNYMQGGGEEPVSSYMHSKMQPIGKRPLPLGMNLGLNQNDLYALKYNLDAAGQNTDGKFTIVDPRQRLSLQLMEGLLGKGRNIDVNAMRSKGRMNIGLKAAAPLFGGNISLSGNYNNASNSRNQMMEEDGAANFMRTPQKKSSFDVNASWQGKPFGSSGPNTKIGFTIGNGSDMGMPIMQRGGEPDGEMALGQIAAVVDKMDKLRQFIQPGSDLEPWISSKLAVMDHYADAVSDYMMYNPEAQEMMGSDEMPEMGRGGYVVTRSSDRKGKTHKVTGPDGTVKYFGDSKLGQHPKDPERKKAFYARHKKNLAGNPYFRAFARATWEDGGQIEEMANGGYVGYDGKRHISDTPNWNGFAGYEIGGELPMAQVGLFTPALFNNLSQFISSRQQEKPKLPPAINYNPNQQAYNMSMIGSGMMSIGEPQGAQLTGATSANPYMWQSFSQTAAPVNPNQTQQVKQQQPVNPIFGDVTKLQGTLKDGSMKDIRKGVKQFNQTYGSNLKVPFGAFGSKGRENMEKFGNASQTAQMAIGIGSLATDLFINNPRIKKENQQRQIMSGMTDALNMAAPEDRGDWVAAGSRIGELRPDQYVVNKGMYTGQFYPTMNMMQSGGGVIDEEIDMPLPLIEMPTTPFSTEEKTPVSIPNSEAVTSASYKAKGANPIANETWSDIASEFEGVKHLGIWGDKKHQKRKSDHNTGDALDVGIINEDQGNKIAQKMIKEAADRNVKYVIWNRKIWNPSVSNEWRPYNGDNPHSSHVHISFNRNTEDLGQISLTHNNPLNIHHGKFASGYGGIQGSKDAGGYVSKFPDLNTGITAAKDLLFGPSYSNLTIEQARNKWVKGDPETPSNSSAHIVKAMGSNKRLVDLSPQERDQLIKQFAKWEGKQAYTKIKDMKLYADGGSFVEGDVYDLTEDQIRSILSLGGNVEFL